MNAETRSTLKRALEAARRDYHEAANHYHAWIDKPGVNGELFYRVLRMATETYLDKLEQFHAIWRADEERKQYPAELVEAQNDLIEGVAS